MGLRVPADCRIPLEIVRLEPRLFEGKATNIDLSDGHIVDLCQYWGEGCNFDRHLFNFFLEMTSLSLWTDCTESTGITTTLCPKMQQS